MIGLPSGGAVVRQGELHGLVERIIRFGRLLVMTGWTADTANDRPSDCVLVFAGGRQAGAGTRTPCGRTWADDHGPAVAQSGFRISARGSPGRPPLHPSGVRVFSVAGVRASELTRLPPPDGDAVARASG